MTDSGINMEALRAEFPILHQKIRGRDLVYLDNGASTQKPLCVLDAMDRYYRQDHSNIHRGVHTLSARATDAYEKARGKIRRFIGAKSDSELIFVRGATEGINLIANSFGRTFIKAGDEILLTRMEHHANIVPWQMIAAERGAIIRVIPMNRKGELDLSSLDELLTERTRIVGVVQVSNALGTVNPVREIIERAKSKGAAVLVDGAQAVSHMPVNVEELGCDFYVLSGHKLYGPTGIGALYIRSKWLSLLPPWQGGGDMIRSVSFEKTEYNDPPYKFEAGTPDIAGAIGLGAAVDFVNRIGWADIERHESDLLAYATERMSRIPGLTIIGQAARKAGVISFTLEGIHPHDIGTIIDQEGVAIRTGHHCAQPVIDYFGIPATARASFAVYNTRAEVDALIAAIEQVRKVFE